ncbi:MAG: hypothetical protein ACKO81_06755, partial [Planctomycetota bacterium]
MSLNRVKGGVHPRSSEIMENGKCCQSESLIQVIWDGLNFRFESRKGPGKPQTASIRGIVFRALKRFE